MKPRRQRIQGVTALQLLEEAAHELRRLRAGDWAVYYVGAGPFVLGFLYFWADMSRSSDAGGRCASWAFGLVLLFLWMKIWQAAFGERVRRVVAGGAGGGCPYVAWRARSCRWSGPANTSRR